MLQGQVVPLFSMMCELDQGVLKQKPVLWLEAWQAEPEGSFLEIAVQVAGMARQLAASSLTITFDNRIFNRCHDISIEFGVRLRVCTASQTALAGLPAQVCAWPWLIELQHAISGMCSQVLTSFATAVEVDGYRKDHEGKPTMDNSSFDTSIKCILNVQRMPMTAAAGHQKFRQQDIGEIELASSKAYNLLSKLLDMTCDDSVRVPRSLLVDEEVVVPKYDMLKMCSVYQAVHEVAAGFWYLAVELEQTQACLKDHEARQDVMSTLDRIEALAVDTASTMEADGNIFQSLSSSCAWRMSPIHIGSWLDASMRVVDELRRLILHMSIIDTQKLAAAVDKLTPKYSHFLNQALFVQTLAKRHLLNAAGEKTREQLGIDCMRLWQSIAQISTLYKRFKMADPKTMPAYNDIIEQSEVVWCGARDALMIVSACRIALVFKGEQQATSAAGLLGKKSAACIPKSLMDLLKSKIGKPDPAPSSGSGIKRKIEETA